MPSRKKNNTEEENQNAVFLDSIHPEKIPVNNFLNPPQILSTSFNKKSKKYQVKFIISGGSELSNIYMRINGIKKDMIYQVPAGKYSFFFRAPLNEYFLELFYTSGSRRSDISTYFKAEN